MSYSTLDTLAIKHGVRIIHPDRPGIGGSNSVPIEERIPVYLAMIPHLLQHLSIEHVSLAAHSFGNLRSQYAASVSESFVPTESVCSFFRAMGASRSYGNKVLASRRTPARGYDRQILERREVGK
jgi:hypothetical protein